MERSESFVAVPDDESMLRTMSLLDREPNEAWYDDEGRLHQVWETRAFKVESRSLTQKEKEGLSCSQEAFHRACDDTLRLSQQRKAQRSASPPTP